MEKSPTIWLRPLTCIFLTGILSLSAVTLARGGNNDLFVIVSGLRSQEGNVHIALYNDPDRFPKSDGMILRAEVPILEGAARHKFTGLTHKLYAVAVYHDENDNDEFDQGFLGVPLEDYAFSNNAPVFLGPPSFARAAFAVPETQEIQIRINE
ncbi:MAG: hypothetical protein CMF66_01055 [Magnetovibrio sp.]|nr:hypothetical protein [Magnetovibrio sp.]